jgi:hypothetical protein
MSPRLSFIAAGCSSVSRDDKEFREMLQTLIVASIVLGAAAYIGRTFVRTVRSARASRNDACSSCGCSSDHVTG